MLIHGLSTPALQGHSGCVKSLNLLLVIEWAAADVPAAEQSWEGVEEVGGGLKLPVSPMCSWLPKQRLDEWTEPEWMLGGV